MWLRRIATSINKGKIMRQGKVKWYNSKKCFGFISPDAPNEDKNKEDVFIHSSVLKESGIRFLNENDVVKFDDEVKNGKLSVTKLELIQRDEESARKFQERRSQFGDRDDRGDRGGYGSGRGDRGDRRPRRDDGEKRSGFAFWKK
jgi:cold shock CspA family protein